MRGTYRRAPFATRHSLFAGKASGRAGRERGFGAVPAL